MQKAFTYIAGILFIAGFIPYIADILRGKTKPQKVSWLIWVSVDTLTLAAMFAAHSVNGQMIGVVFAGWLAVAFILKHGKPGWSLGDKLGLIGAAFGIILWKLLGNSVPAIIVCQGVIFGASYWTFKSAHEEPAKENKTAWVIWWLSCVFAVLAIPHYTWADATQPWNFFAIETVMVYLTWFRPLLMTNQSAAIHW